LGWTYDGVGNRQTENGNSYTYLTGSNKLNSANGQSYGYDNSGNTTAEGARLFVYNQNQRLIRVLDGGVTKGEYTYNGNGQRVKKIAAGMTTIFHYSLNGQIIAESNSAGTMTAEYVYLNGQPLAKMEGANTYYYHNDHLATPQKMTDSSGAVVWSADYKPFGEATVNPSLTVTNTLRFPGQYCDVETGLHYNYFRDYSPVIGRYIEKDPIGMKGGINLFSYVGNNALNWTDRLGLWRTPHHDRIINRFVDLYIPTLDPIYIQAIREGSKYADTFQESEYSYIHHMRDGKTGQSKADAEALMNKYIDHHIQKYKCDMTQGKYNEAYKHLGMALHPIMDSTSPTHGDFLPWQGVIPLLLSGIHAAGEATIDDSQIELTIDRMLKILR
jgi:RHS repeat-associated protein